MNYNEYLIVERFICLMRTIINIISIILMKRLINIRRWWTKPYLQEPVKKT